MHFMVLSSSSFLSVADKENVLPFENKLPIFNQMLTKYPNNTRFMKFVADAPTTTLQRLKGITTGSLPTFIDVGSNFATSEINEDNFIDQVHLDHIKYNVECYRIFLSFSR